MKKVFSIVLAAAMLMSCFVTSASAHTGHDQLPDPMPTFTLSFQKLAVDGVSESTEPGDPVAGDMFQAIVKVTGIETIWSTQYKMSYDSEVVTIVNAAGVPSESAFTLMSKPIRHLSYTDANTGTVQPMNALETIIPGTETKEVNGKTHKVFGYMLGGDLTATWTNASGDDVEEATHVHIDATEGVVVATFRFKVLKDGDPQFAFIDNETLTYADKRQDIVSILSKDTAIGAIVGTVAGHTYGEIGDLDRAAVDAALAAIEAKTYTTPGDSAFVAASNSERYAILTALIAADVLALGTGVTVSNAGSDAYTLPVNGTKENPAGTNGRYPVIYSFSKGEALKYINKALIVTAMPYDEIANADLDAVNAALAAIEAKTYTIPGDSAFVAATEDEQYAILTALIADDVLALGTGVTVAQVGTKPWKLPVNGTKENPAGTNGWFSLDYRFSKGEATSDQLIKNFIITAMPYVGDPDLAAVNAALAMIRAKNYAIPGDSAFVAATEAEQHAILEAMVADDVLALGTGVTVAQVGSNPCSLPINGTKEHPDGTNGSFVLDYRFYKGAATSDQLMKEFIITAMTYDEVGKSDLDAVNAALAAIEAKIYTIPGDSAFVAATEDEQYAILDALIADDVLALGTGVTVAQVGTYPWELPVNGTKEDPAGTNGSFGLGYRFSKGEATSDKLTKEFIITAMPYVGDPDLAAVNAALAAIEAKIYTIPGDSAFVAVTEAEQHAILTAMVEDDVLALGTGVTVAQVGSNPWELPVNGTKEHPAGTNGSFDLDYRFYKGEATSDQLMKNFIITAMPYDGTEELLDAAAAVLKEVPSMKSYTIGAVAFQKLTTDAEKIAALQAKIDLVMAKVNNGTIAVAKSTTIANFTPAVAGTTETPAGINGGYEATFTLSKGVKSRAVGATKEITLSMIIQATAFVEGTALDNIIIKAPNEAALLVAGTLGGNSNNAFDKAEKDYNTYLLSSTKNNQLKIGLGLTQLKTGEYIEIAKGSETHKLTVGNGITVTNDPSSGLVLYTVDDVTLTAASVNNDVVTISIKDKADAVVNSYTVNVKVVENPNISLAVKTTAIAKQYTMEMSLKNTTFRAATVALQLDNDVFNSFMTKDFADTVTDTEFGMVEGTDFVLGANFSDRLVVTAAEYDSTTKTMMITIESKDRSPIVVGETALAIGTFYIQQNTEDNTPVAQLKDKLTVGKGTLSDARFGVQHIQNDIQNNMVIITVPGMYSVVGFVNTNLTLAQAQKYVTIDLTDIDATSLLGGQLINPVATANGRYVASVNGGKDYQLKVNLKGYLEVVKEGIDITNDHAYLETINMVAGDLNGDQSIDTNDRTMLLTALNQKISTPDSDAADDGLFVQVGETKVYADFNGDGTVDALDLGILLANYTPVAP